MDRRSDLSDVIAHPSANPACDCVFGCVCVCVSSVYFPKTTHLLTPLIATHTNAPSLPKHTHIPRGILYFFIWAPVGACIGCSALSSSLFFFFSSSSVSCASLLLLLLLLLSPLCRSHSLVFFFFPLQSCVCRLYLTEGPVPRSHPRAPSTTTL